jgi:hypothetical protein
LFGPEGRNLLLLKLGPMQPSSSFLLFERLTGPRIVVSAGRISRYVRWADFLLFFPI